MLEVRQLARPGLLHPATLSISAGECGVVMGQSGAGKSVLARAIADLDPNEGDVLWQGQSRNAMPAPQWRRLVAYVPAESGWWAQRVGEHFVHPDNADDLLTAVGLTTEAMNWSISRTSSGERQRLALVRALAMQPQALVLDEPTSALDASSRQKVEALLQRLLGEGVAILLITHDAAQARRLGSRFWRMEQGRLEPEQMPPEL